MKSWKSYEKKLTEFLSQGPIRAIRKSRGLRGEAVEDVAWAAFSLEAKTRKKWPAYIKKWMAQAKANCEERIPVVVWHEDRSHLPNDLVVLRLQDFKNLVEKAYS